MVNQKVQLLLNFPKNLPLIKQFNLMALNILDDQSLFKNLKVRRIIMVNKEEVLVKITKNLIHLQEMQIFKHQLYLLVDFHIILQPNLLKNILLK